MTQLRAYLGGEASLQVARDHDAHWCQRYQTNVLMSDALIVSITIAAVYVTQSLASPALGAQSTQHSAVAAAFALAWLLCLEVFQSRDAHILGQRAIEYKRVLNASIASFGVLSLVFLVVSEQFARSYVIAALPAGVLLLLCERWAWRHWLTVQREQGRFLTKAIVVGDPDDIRFVTTQIGRSPSAPYSIVGSVPTRSTPYTDVAVPLIAADGYSHVARSTGATTVIIAGPLPGGRAALRDLAWTLEGTATDLVLASSLTDVAGPRIHFHPVEGLPLIHVEIPQYEGPKHAIKRAFDVVGSGLGLLALSPLLVIVALLIKIDDGGPVLFRQERVGRGEQTFKMLKFRSMVTDAELQLESLRVRNEGAGDVLFKMRDDPRVTRIGHWLRRFSIDELPQLWNVLIGDMSLVGPRPPLQSEVEKYADHVHRRLYIKPGLTGMWQVNGRSDLSWDDSVRLDLYYVENWSLMGDLMILWRTLRVLVEPKGAY